MTAQDVAEAILRAAGSDLRHYTPYNRDHIIAAAKGALDAYDKAKGADNDLARL